MYFSIPVTRILPRTIPFRFIYPLLERMTVYITYVPELTLVYDWERITGNMTITVLLLLSGVQSNCNANLRDQ